ncbi:MAG: VOC family protein [Peptostreptococcus sp.]|uniref:VOC family protein n=1 Tax=Peptostreptococcus sp. TaxID=1262 RepID=UPI002FC9E6A2
MSIQVKYTTIIVDDMEESIKFYREVLGFEIDSVYRLPPKGEPVVGSITLMKSEGDTMVELIKNNEYNTGFYSIGMEVNDMETTINELKEKGAKIIAEPVNTGVGSCAFIEDPNGVKICIIHHF